MKGKDEGVEVVIAVTLVVIVVIDTEVINFII